MKCSNEFINNFYLVHARCSLINVAVICIKVCAIDLYLHISILNLSKVKSG